MATVPGLTMEVVDATSGSRICDANVVATEGAYSETLVADGSCEYHGLQYRPGAYTVAVTRDGYRPTTIEVTLREDCNKAFDQAGYEQPVRMSREPAADAGSDGDADASD